MIKKEGYNDKERGFAAKSIDYTIRGLPCLQLLVSSLAPTKVDLYEWGQSLGILFRRYSSCNSKTIR